MLQTTINLNGVDIELNTENALDLFTLEHCEAIIEGHNLYAELTEEEKKEVHTPNAANHTLYLIALFTMETKYPVEFASHKLDHDASNYEPEYPQ